jgi:pantothenate synthetase
MSGNIILDSMKKKETVALTKILEAMKLLGKADPNSEKILEEAEKELGIGKKKETQERLSSQSHPMTYEAG